MVYEEDQVDTVVPPKKRKHSSKTTDPKTPASTQGTQHKRTSTEPAKIAKPAKKSCSSNTIRTPTKQLHTPAASTHNGDCLITGSYDPAHTQVWPYFYYPVDLEWQQNACAALGLEHVHPPPRGRGGGANVSLTPPDPYHIRDIIPDGNCMFRSFSYVITGSQNSAYGNTQSHIEHMVGIAHLLYAHHYDLLQVIQVYRST